MDPNPFVPLGSDEFADMITHCVTCHAKRPADPLNGSGYCQPCWEYIPARFRTAAGRGDEQRRMFQLVKKAARAKRRDLRVPTLYWNEERNTWLWSVRRAHYIVTKHGDVLDCWEQEAEAWADQQLSGGCGFDGHKDD